MTTNNRQTQQQLHSQTTVKLIIDDVVPNAGAEDSQHIVAVWRALQNHLQGLVFRVEDPSRAELDEFVISIDAHPVIALLEDASRDGQSFADYLQRAIEQDLPLGADLDIQIQSSLKAIEPRTIFHAVNVLVHQIMLAMNIALPGSCQFLETYYDAEGAELFEAPELDSAMFTNAWLSAQSARWPKLQVLPIADVWQWLNMQCTSETDTALRAVNKVLFGLLELAQPRQLFAAGDVLLVAHMLETLVNASEDNSYSSLVRDRILSILGIPDSREDSFNELYRLKRAMIRGALPVRRPPFICHTADDEVLQQLDAHNSPVEEALAVLTAVIQDLVITKSAGYTFTETFNRI